MKTYGSEVEHVAMQYHNYWHGHGGFADCPEPTCKAISKGPSSQELVPMLHAAGHSQIAYILEAHLQVKSVQDISETEQRYLHGDK